MQGQHILDAIGNTPMVELVLSDECELVSVFQPWQSVRPPEGCATRRERRRGWV